jgi:hypothetical protein
VLVPASPEGVLSSDGDSVAGDARRMESLADAVIETTPVQSLMAADAPAPSFFLDQQTLSRLLENVAAQDAGPSAPGSSLPGAAGAVEPREDQAAAGGGGARPSAAAAAAGLLDCLAGQPDQGPGGVEGLQPLQGQGRARQRRASLDAGGGDQAVGLELQVGGGGGGPVKLRLRPLAGAAAAAGAGAGGAAAAPHAAQQAPRLVSLQLRAPAGASLVSLLVLVRGAAGAAPAQQPQPAQQPEAQPAAAAPAAPPQPAAAAAASEAAGRGGKASRAARASGSAQGARRGGSRRGSGAASASPRQHRAPAPSPPAAAAHAPHPQRPAAAISLQAGASVVEVRVASPAPAALAAGRGGARSPGGRGGQQGSRKRCGGLLQWLLPGVMLVVAVHHLATGGHEARGLHPGGCHSCTADPLSADLWLTTDQLSSA